VHVLISKTVQIAIVCIQEVVDTELFYGFRSYDRRIAKHDQTDDEVRDQTKLHHFSCLRCQM
jgi:hypothetical protein